VLTFDDHECVVGVMSLNGGSIKPCSKPTYRRGGLAGGVWSHWRGSTRPALLALSVMCSVMLGLFTLCVFHILIIQCLLLNLLSAFVRGHHLLYEFLMRQNYISYIKRLAAVFNMIGLIFANYLFPS